MMVGRIRGSLEARVLAVVRGDGSRSRSLTQGRPTLRERLTDPRVSGLGGQVVARVGNITFDCDDALLVARFWSAALGRPLDPGGDPGYASIGGGDPVRADPAWYFERVPETKSAKNRVHVDLIDPDPGAVERLVALGATIVAARELGGHAWTVLQDPEGNEFGLAAKSFES